MESVINPEIENILSDVSVWIAAGNDEIKRLLSEASPGVYNSALLGGLFYNPDALASRQGLRIYDEMLNDDLIKPLMELKKAAIISRPLKIEWPGASEVEKDFAKYAIMEAPDRPLNLILYDALTALEYGFSVSEKIFSYITDGNWRGRIRLKDLKPLVPHYVKFILDQKDRVIAIEYDPNFGGARLPIGKVWHYTHAAKFGNPYGKSDLAAAHRSFFHKDINIKAWSIHLERFGSPTAIGKFPKDMDKTANGEAAISNFMKILRNLRTAGYASIPKDVFEIDFVEAKQGGDFEAAITMHNTLIARSLLMPDNLGFTSQKYGSRALGENQKSLFEMALEYIGQTLLSSFSWQVLYPLIKTNFKSDYTPNLAFDTSEQPDFKTASEIMARAAASGFLSINDESDINEARERLGLPKVAPAEWEIWLNSRQQANAQLADDVKKTISNIREARETVETRAESDAESVQRATEHLKNLDVLQAEIKDRIVKILDDREKAIEKGIRQASDTLDFSVIRKMISEKTKLQSAVVGWLEKVVRSGRSDARGDAEKS